MKGLAVHVATFLVGLPSLVGAVQVQGHPIVKVISLLQGLKMKTEGMGNVEAGSYEKFQLWCKDSSDTLEKSISDEKATISELSDTIAGKSKEQDGLQKQISELSDEIAALDAGGLQAEKVRADEAALYKQALADYKGTIKAVGDALEGVKKAGTETKTGLLQAQHKAKQALALVGAFVTQEQRNAIESFVQDRQKPLLADGDKSSSLEKYNFKSGNILELLQAMLKKFQAEKVAATDAETNSLNAYELSSKALENSRSAADASKKKKEVELAEVKKALSDAKGDLKDQKDDLEADTETLGQTQGSCLTKSQEWDERTKTRNLEVEAMGMAIKNLSKASGVRTEAPKNPTVLIDEANSFLQLADPASANPKLRAVNLLKQTATTVHSRALERLATEISAHLDGPFDAINNSIEKMIFRLMDEQKKEDSHKSWCDQELAKTEAMKDNKDDKIQELDAELKTETAGVAQLTEDIKAAETMISSIVASTKEATEIRNIGKKENKAAIADAEQAQQAILKAMGVLQAFYEDSGKVQASFLEAPSKLAGKPSTWDSGYSGIADPTQQPDGIISVLKSVNADFEKLEAETKSQETTDQLAYDQLVQKETIEKARRTKEVEMKGNRKMQKVDAITQMTGTRKNVGSEKEKAAQYLNDLDGACVSGDDSYEKRKQARDTETAALRKAQGFLDAAFEEKSAAFLSRAQVHVQTKS